MKKFGVIVLIAVSISACSWVTLTPEGRKTRVATAAEVSGCRKVGLTTSTTKAVVAGFERNEDRVKEELQFLARNAAPDLGGDTVVPVGAPRDGRQTFDVYRCGGP